MRKCEKEFQHMQKKAEIVQYDCYFKCWSSL